MTSRAAIPIEPSVLRWARESIGLSVPAAAKKAGVKPEKLEKWESDDEALPTARQLEKFANAYKRPMAVFFRTEPPPEPALPADFRVLKSGDARSLSPESILAIRRARELQSTYGELHGAERSARIQLNVGDDAEKSALDVRKSLGVSIEEQVSVQRDDAALRVWRGAVERTALLVFQFPFPVAEMRGFSLPGDPPAIVLNNRDAHTARSFTLFHEAAHVWLGRPGICNPDGRIRIKQKSNLEVYCNAFAAELLLPMREFLLQEPVVAYQEARKLRVERPALRPILDKVSRRFHVSSQVVLRRMFTAQLITEPEYREWASQLVKEAIARAKRQKKEPSGGPAPSRKALSELGEPFVRVVLRARDAGVITDADVTDYLYGNATAKS